VRDLVAPTVTATVAKRLKRARFARAGLVTRVRCSEACAVTVEVRLKARVAKRLKLPRVIARGTGAERVKVKPGPVVRRKLRRAKGVVRATVAVRVVDAAGNARTVTRALKLSR
jgi:hypothetical protein